MKIVVAWIEHQVPGADDALTLEREPALVSQIHIKEPGVILAAASGYGCCPRRSYWRTDYCRIVGRRRGALRFIRGVGRLNTNHGVRQAQCRVDSCVWPGHARKCESHRTEPSEMLARVIALEENLIKRDLARSGFAKHHERHWRHEGERDVLRQFELPAVLAEVLRFHAPEIKEQALARGQSLVLTVPVPKLDECVLAAKLVLISVLGLQGQGERQLIRLRMDGGELSDHPVVELGLRVFAREEIAHDLGVGDLRILDCELFVGDVEAVRSRGNLAVHLSQLGVGQLRLEIPFVHPPLVAAHGPRHATRLAKNAGQTSCDTGPRPCHTGNIFASVAHRYLRRTPETGYSHGETRNQMRSSRRYIQDDGHAGCD